MITVIFWIVILITLIITAAILNRSISIAYTILNKQLIDLNDNFEKFTLDVNKRLDNVEKNTKLNRIDLTAIRDKMKANKPKVKKTKKV